jgi:hypothetical protein
MVEDLDIFFSDFAESFLVDGQSEVLGIFDESYEPLFSDSEGRNLALTIKSLDAININHGSHLIKGARTFEVVGIAPIDDGEITKLILKEID